MRFAIGLAALLLCSGCSYANRSITFVYYPRIANTSAFFRDAQRECEKYGMFAEISANGSSDFGRLTETYVCVAK
jgi:hypothetical protein